MQYFERHQGGERAILVHMNIKNLDDSEDLSEFILLAKSAGAQVVAKVTGNRLAPHAKYFVGSGKADEICNLVKAHEADIVIFDHALSPSQERNLEQKVQCRVLDRTGLILDIFAQRAQTFEGKLQVELAQLSHLSTRLVRGWTHLERQKGGIGLRGPGETQLETDRRLLQIRVLQLKQKLAKVKQTRQQGRSRRQKSSIPTIALVGYTNSGKSTLFNTLTSANILAQDKLFATLDPTLRKYTIPNIGEAIIADTVGFVRHLPHELVESFHATLEEVLQADLLLHVIDSNSTQKREQIDAVNDVLQQIGADIPSILVYNKIDLSNHAPEFFAHNKSVYVSALTGAGVDKLHEAICFFLVGQIKNYAITVAPKYGAFINDLHKLSAIVNEAYADTGAQILSLSIAPKILNHLLNKHNILPQNIKLNPDFLDDLHDVKNS